MIKTLVHFWNTTANSLHLHTNFNSLDHKIRLASSFGAVNVFDRNAKRRQKDRASMCDDPSVYDYLRDAVASQIVDRVYDVSRSAVD